MPSCTNDFQVKLRGYRVELGEIERACESVPGVEASERGKWGQRPHQC